MNLEKTNDSAKCKLPISSIIDAKLAENENPEVILIHPMTWIKLVIELVGDEGLEKAKHKQDVRYNGVIMFRSLDLKLEEIYVF